MAISLECAVAAVGVPEMQKIVRAPGVPSEADKKAIDDYMKSFFSSFLKPADGMTVPNLRKDYGIIVRGVGKTPGHDLLNHTALKYASTVITRGAQFSPQARYNAMLLISDLNESDIPAAIKPYKPAVDWMQKCLDMPADSSMAYLQPAALIGVTRLAEEKALPPADLAKISASLLKLLKDNDPPAGRSASAHNFVRRSAARALAAIGSPGPNNDVVTAMRTIMVDPNSKLALRCEMAQLLGQLTIPPEAKVDSKDLANLIGHQTVEICEQELLRSEEEKRDPSRRILLYALKSADVGLGGLLNRSAEKTPEAAGFISKLRSKITQVYNPLDDVTKTADGKIREFIVPELETIRELLIPKAEPAAPPTPTPAPPATETAARPK